MSITFKEWKKVLVDPGHIRAEDFEAATAEAKESGVDLPTVLLAKELIQDQELGKLASEIYDVPLLDLSREAVDEKVLTKIPELVAKTQKVAAIGRDSAGIKVGMANPKDLMTRSLVEKRLGEPIVVYYITPRDLKEALAFYRGSIRDEITGTLAKLKTEAKPADDHELITTLIDQLLAYGHQSKASDIHIEPHRETVVIRFRIDGVMHDILDLPKSLFSLILTRLKVMARLRIDEHLTPQDGKIEFTADGEPIDIRISIVPVTGGENVVMRLLSEGNRRFSLTDLGLSDKDLKKVKVAIAKPYGMILVTGPTGSGKTTTVYAVLKILNQPEVHIATIEDPVEYDIEGISQIQVNTQTKLTFARGLRSIVRQDPDIIMIGEIRDEETADIAVNAALTGHLVLSTIHTNDAATTLPRLLDMGIDPFLIGSTVNIAIAQRLVRKICNHCRRSYEPAEAEAASIDADPTLKKLILSQAGRKQIKGLTLYHGTGCLICNDTGYAGRIGIFEVLEMTDELKQLVLKRASSGEIQAVARVAGLTLMIEDGIDKMIKGVTTLEEILRVTRS